jgi:GNAT superfamily N-acetyltransferase
MSDEIEAIERAALQDLHDSATEALRAALGLDCRPSGTGLVSLASALPASAIVANRTIGLGLAAPETRSAVAEAIERYRAAGIGRFFVHLHPEARPAQLVDWLGELGLEATRGWMKFSRGRAAPPRAETALDLRPARTEDAEAFGRIVTDAFDLGPAAAPWVAGLIGRSGWHVYVSEADGHLAGTGSLFVRDGVGWIDWGATAPAFRGRGSQSALLHRRITDALDMGCRKIVTTTGEAVAGDPQHSYNNIVRMGFEPAYLRRNFAPPKPA